VVVLLDLDAGEVGVDAIDAAGDAGGDVGHLPLVVVEPADGQHLAVQFPVGHGLGVDAGPFLEPGDNAGELLDGDQVHAADRHFCPFGSRTWGCIEQV
jgi:hypothetical protein